MVLCALVYVFTRGPPLHRQSPIVVIQLTARNNYLLIVLFWFDYNNYAQLYYIDRINSSLVEIWKNTPRLRFAVSCYNNYCFYIFFSVYSSFPPHDIERALYQKRVDSLVRIPWVYTGKKRPMKKNIIIMRDKKTLVYIIISWCSHNNLIYIYYIMYATRGRAKRYNDTTLYRVYIGECV